MSTDVMSEEVDQNCDSGSSAPAVGEVVRDPSRVRSMNSGRPKPVKCSRSLINFWIDALLLVLYVLLAWVTAVLNFVFPPAANATGWLLWGGDVVFWRDFQFGILCLLSAGITLHLMLHWAWICGVVNRQIFRRELIPTNGTETLVGVGLIVLVLNVLAAGLLLAWWCVQRP